MLKMAIRRVLAERPYRTACEIAVLLNYTEGTVRRNLKEMPDVTGVSFKKHRLFCLRGVVPEHIIYDVGSDPGTRILQAVEISVSTTGSAAVTIRRESGGSCQNLLAALKQRGPFDLPALAGHIASDFCCSKQAAQVFLVAYSAWARRETGCCVFDEAVGSLRLEMDLQQACTDLRQAGLLVPDRKRPFSDEGLLAGHIVEGVWRWQA